MDIVYIIGIYLIVMAVLAIVWMIRVKPWESLVLFGVDDGENDDVDDDGYPDPYIW